MARRKNRRPTSRRTSSRRPAPKPQQDTTLYGASHFYIRTKGGATKRCRFTLLEPYDVRVQGIDDPDFSARYYSVVEFETLTDYKIAPSAVSQPPRSTQPLKTGQIFQIGSAAYVLREVRSGRLGQEVVADHQGRRALLHFPDPAAFPRLTGRALPAV